MTEAAAYRHGIYKSDLVRKIALWLEAPPHPPIALEIAPDRISGARFSRTGSLDGFAVEALPAGAILPSAVETNLVNLAAVRTAMEGIRERLRVREEDAALLLPDPVVRVFVQHFEQFPRSAKEAVPMLRWKLKKSVPFEAEETLISYMRQAPREGGVDVVTALGRLRIVREYEAVSEQAGFHPGVVLSSSLAAVSLLEDRRPALLARVSGASLTTAIVREGVLCGSAAPICPRRRRNLRRRCCWKRFIRWRRTIRIPGKRESSRYAWQAWAPAWQSSCRRSKRNFTARCIRCCTPPFPRAGFPTTPGLWRKGNWKVWSVG